MRYLLAAAMLVACGHRDAADVRIKLTCAGQTHALAVTNDLRVDEHLCGKPWTALRIEHGTKTELVNAVAGREVWLRRLDQRALIEVRAAGAITSTFDAVTEIAEDAAAPREASIEIDANGAVTQLPLAQFHTRFEAAGSGGRDVSLCAVAAAYVPAFARIEVTGEASDPVVVTAAECATRGLVLRASSQGDLRLRGASGDHLLQRVERIGIRL